MQCDPEAAKIVFETPNITLVQIPLEVRLILYPSACAATAHNLNRDDIIPTLNWHPSVRPTGHTHMLGNSRDYK